LIEKREIPGMKIKEERMNQLSNYLNKTKEILSINKIGIFNNKRNQDMR
jgi:hypothetical protein